MALIDFLVIDLVTGAPIPGVLLSSVGGPGPWLSMSDGDGMVSPDLAPAHYDITFSKDGYVTRVLPADIGGVGPVITVGLTPVYVHVPGGGDGGGTGGGEGLWAQRRGIDIVDAQGNRRVFNGVDQFQAFKQFREGGETALGSAIAESKAIGFDLWRVFFEGSVAQNQVMQLDPRDPGFYQDVRPFVDVLNSHGIVLLATAYVDNQDFRLGVDHWERLAEGLRDHWVVLSGGNEYSKNGFDPGMLTDPRIPFWSRGSDIGDKMPFSPHGPVCEFHPRRDLPAAHLDTVASPVYIYQSGFEVPLIIDEPPRMGTNGSRDEFTIPRLCYEFARHYATETSGAVFHNWFGQRGLGMDAATRACAEAWTAGMRL